MPTRVYIDKIEDLEMEENWGVLIGLTRRAIVVGLTGFTYATIYQALTAAGIPPTGSYLDEANVELELTRRSVKMIDSDKAEVILVYSQFNDKGQPLFAGGLFTGLLVAGKMTTSVVEKDANQYRDEGIGPLLPIELEHTYPSDDEDYAGKTIQQTGKIKVNIPQRVFTIEGVKQVAAPWEMAERLIRCVNNAVWLGQPAHTWMCTEVTWEFRRASNYFMTFVFQHEEDSWNPTAIFIDDRTSRPPKDLVDGQGIKTLRYFRAVNFVSELGFFVIGPTQV